MERSGSAARCAILGVLLSVCIAPAGFAQGGRGRWAAGSAGARVCQGLSGRAAGAAPVLRVPLAVHVGGSMAGYDEICSIAEEINEILFTQAGICFEMELDEVFVNTGDPGRDRSAEKRADRLNLWLLSSGRFFPASPNANGVFLGQRDEAYTLDRPSLALGGVRELSRNPAARTGAHELGHALGLNHQDCGAPCDNLLMRSGRRGFELVTGAPGNTDEIARARNVAMVRMLRGAALLDASRTECAPPRFIAR